MEKDKKALEQKLIKQIEEKDRDAFNTFRDLAFLNDEKEKMEKYGDELLELFNYDKGSLSAVGQTFYWECINNKKAIECYLKYLELNPGDAYSYWELANIYWDEEDFDSAEYYYLKSIAFDPSNSRSYVSLAGMYFNDFGELDESKLLILKAIELEKEPADNYPYYLLIDICIERKEYEEAVEFAKKAVAYIPDDEESQELLKKATELLNDSK